MIKNTRTRLYMSAIVNCFIAALEIIGTVICAYGTGFGMFKYYTTDSNLLSLFSSFLCMMYSFNAAKAGNPLQVPKFVRLLKLASVSCLAVTFIVVTAIFAPVMGENGYNEMLFYGDFFYFHLTCPLLSIFSLVLFEGDGRIGTYETVLAVIPTVVYALTVVMLNMLELLEGPYPFLIVNSQPLYISVSWFIAIVGGAFMITTVIRTLSQLMMPSNNIQKKSVENVNFCNTDLSKLQK